MALKDSFGLWTHKGGVGKTTMAFHLSTFYAGMFDGKTRSTLTQGQQTNDLLEHRAVIVVDMDPQANLSEALLTSSTGTWKPAVGDSGGGGQKFQKTSARRKPGGENVEALSEKFVGSKKLPQNVSGALTAMHRNIMEDDPTVYLVKVFDYNKNIPDNLWLLCGDYNLESMDTVFQAGFDGVNKGLSKPFVETASLLTEFLKKCATKMGQPTVAFIDCNPAFTGYTKVALAASKSLVVPVNSDDFSAGAIKMMLRKLYNRFPVGESHPFRDDMVETSFAAKSKKFIKPLKEFPKVRVLVHNREAAVLTSRGAKALIKMRDDINSRMRNEAVVNFAESESQKIGLDMLVPPQVSVASSNHTQPRASKAGSPAPHAAREQSWIASPSYSH